MSTIQSGQLLHTLFGGLLVSLLVTWLFLLFYRRAVKRTMRTTSGRGGLDAAVADREAPITATARRPQHAGNTSLVATQRRVRLRLGIVYASAFGASAALLQAPNIIQAWQESSDGLGLLRAVVTWYPSWAAAVFIIAALVVASRRESWLMLLAVCGAGCVLSVAVPALIRIIKGRALELALLANAGWFLLAFALMAALPLLLIYLTGRPRVRNVLPLTLVLVMSLSMVVMLVFHGYMLLFPPGVELELTTLRTLAMQVGPTALCLLLALPAGWIAWYAAGQLAQRYRNHRFSDMQLLADAWWALITCATMVVQWDRGPWIAIGCALGGWLVYFCIVRVGLRWARLGQGQGGPPLLLLRVFGHPARTARLYERVAARWRFNGPVAMIAGADLATQSIDVDEALAFAHGEIESSYVADTSTLTQRLQALRAQPDPDGRYRVEEFFCFDDTWRPTLQALVARSRLVLMDLRGFTRDNAGCLFELEQLAASGRLADCVFVVDASTDRALAEQTLRSASTAAAAPDWFALTADHGAALDALRARLLQVAASAPG